MGRLKNSRTPFPSLSLSSNASLLTCIGNDFGFERIFSRQIEGIGTTGTDRFYTIFSGGINYFFSPLEYAVGLGLGTSIDWKKSWSNQFEIQAFAISHEKEITNNSTNNIIQMRFPFCKELGKHFKLFAGPTLNIGLQEAEIAESARLSQWAMWSSKWNGLDVSGWIGLSAGLRF